MPESETVLTPVSHPKIRRASLRSKYIKALLYGDAGAGKTWLSCTAPNALILLTEPAVSDATIAAVKRTLGYNPDVWEISDWDDLDDAYEFLSEAKHGYRTIVVDSLTDLYRRAVTKIIDVSSEKRLQKGGVHDPDVLEEGDWQRVAAKLRIILRNFRDLPVDTVFTALVMDIRGETKRVPYVQPKNFAREIIAYFNLVGYLGVTMEGGKPVRKLLVTPDDMHAAKNYAEVLPPIVNDPNLHDIFEQIDRFNSTDE